MFDVVIVANGKSERMGFDKLSANIGNISVLNRSVNAFKAISDINKIIVVSDSATIDGVVVVPGGATRALSVRQGLKYVESEYVLIHDGARPFVSGELIERVMSAAKTYNAAAPVIPSSDSIREVSDNRIVKIIDRKSCALVQTPQGFSTELLKSAFEKIDVSECTDETEILLKCGIQCHTVYGDVRNRKITNPTDLFGINAKVGTGFDVHRFVNNKVLKLCGLEIPHDKGLLAHSDGDAPLHALMDALLTAVGERDIGVLFPDSDPRYKDIDSTLLLKEVLKKITHANTQITSVNLTIIAQNPRLSPHIEAMRQNLARLLDIKSELISLSATTAENMGLIGQNEALAALAAVTII